MEAEKRSGRSGRSGRRESGSRKGRRESNKHHRKFWDHQGAKVGDPPRSMKALLFLGIFLAEGSRLLFSHVFCSLAHSCKSGSVRVL